MSKDAFIVDDVVPVAVRAAEETVWVNPRLLPFDVVDGLSQLVVSDEDIANAAARLRHFAPFIRRAFPETAETDGLQHLIDPAALFPRRRRRMVSSSRRCARFLRCRRGFLMHTEQRFRGVSC